MDVYKNPDGSLKISISFLGATNGIVTGSRTLVHITRGSVTRNILVDCGGFQGKEEELNFESLIEPDSIDCVLLTHAHFDHCGALPLLFKPIGDVIPYNGKVYASKETCAHAAPILIDAAKINERKMKEFNLEYEDILEALSKERAKAIREGASLRDISGYDSSISSIEEQQEIGLYDMIDANTAIEHFEPVEVFSNPDNNPYIPLFEGIDARFIPNSHIDGATMIELVASYGDSRYVIVFTGDIGKSDTILYRDIDYKVLPNYGDCLIMEALHGIDEPEETLEESIRMLWKILKYAGKKKKKVNIALFSLDRAPGVIKILNDFMDAGMWLNCYIDSPLIETELLSYISCYNSNKSAWFNYYTPRYPFRLERFKLVKDYAEHMFFTKFNGQSHRGVDVSLTSSCMGYGGRVLDYFEHHIQSEDSIFIFPGFILPDCPSRILHEAPKGKLIEINGRKYIKHCETFWLKGFSAHGYLEDKIKILRRYPNVSKIFLNHGEQGAITQLRDKLSAMTNKEVIIPNLGESFDLI